MQGPMIGGMADHLFPAQFGRSRSSVWA